MYPFFWSIVVVTSGPCKLCVCSNPHGNGTWHDHYSWMMMGLDHSTTKWGASSTPLSSHRPRHFDQRVVSLRLRRREVYDNNRTAPRRGQLILVSAQPTKSMPLFGFPRCRSFPCMGRPSSSSS